jgi:tetratricopeptide (TPR) repeat protein
MGETAVARFRKALARRWREASDAAGAKGLPARGILFDVELWTLQRMYLEQLEAAGDVDGALSVLRRNVSSPRDHAEVTRFLERHGRLREAFSNAELAYQAFPDDASVQDDLLRCYERDGWFEEALTLRRRQFDEQPSLGTYRGILAAGEAAGRDVPSLRSELHAALVEMEERWMKERPEWARDLPGLPDGTQLRDVTLRTRILCDEARWDEALAAVRPPARCNEDVLLHLASALGAEQQAQRVELLMTVFGRAMAGSTSPYQKPLELVAEIATSLDPARRAAWLAELRAKYKLKRNFVRELPRA